MKDYRTLALLFEQEPAFLIFQDICLMFFYHEAGHLIQRSGEPSAVYREFGDAKSELQFIRERHVRELDADWFSANNYSQSILEYSHSKATLNLSLVEFEDLVALLLSSIYIYFIRASEGVEMYFEEYWHPHPVIRLTFYVQTVLDTLANLGNITLNKQFIANAAKHIADVVLSDRESAAPKYYDYLVDRHRAEIRPYILKILNNTATYPYSSWRLLSSR